MKENDVSIFSSNQKTSLINYKKIQLMTPDIQSLTNQLKKYSKNNNQIKPLFFYDKYTNQFIFINGEVIIILDTKCQMKTFSRIKLEQEIKSVSVEYNNKYMLFTTFDYKIHLINLEDLEEIDCNINKKWQYVGGFFIKHKRPQKEHDYFIVCLMTVNNFNIKRITKTKDLLDNSFQYSNKHNYISNKMKILDYDFNPVFKILLIIKANPFSTLIFNLKSKNSYRVPIKIEIENLLEQEYKLYLQQIYEKLYLIHFDNKNNINIYRLDILKKLKTPKKILYDASQNLEIKNIKFQFYNNLIIIYMPNYIKVFDIKSKNPNYEVAILNLSSNDYNHIINKGNIFGKYILMNDEYYKIKFMKSNYKNHSNSMTKEVFFTLLRRKKSNELIKGMLYNYLNNCQFWNFFDILEEIVIKNKKYIKRKSEEVLDNKNNAYKVFYIGCNQFFLTEDYLITLFSQYFDKSIKPETLIKALCYMHNLYKKYEVNMNVNLFYASLFGQLNKTDNVDLIDYAIRNKIIPINEKIGLYFIMKSKCFKDEEKNKKCFSLGFDILINEINSKDININDILDNIKDNDFKDSYDIVLNLGSKNIFSTNLNLFK